MIGSSPGVGVTFNFSFTLSPCVGPSDGRDQLTLSAPPVKVKSTVLNSPSAPLMTGMDSK